MVRYVPVYHTGLLFVPEIHVGTNQHILYPFIYLFFLFFFRYTLVSLLRSIPALLNFHFEH
jgi:hypothetical protein